MFVKKNLQLNNSKTKTAMNAKISVFVICVEAIIYLLHNFQKNRKNITTLLEFRGRETWSYTHLHPPTPLCKFL